MRSLSLTLLVLLTTAANAAPRYALTILPPLANTTANYGFGVNDSGVVCGYATRSWDGSSRAVIWQNGTPTEIGVGEPRAINNSGVVCGTYFNPETCVNTAMKWSSGTAIPLGSTSAWDINNSGAVVGSDGGACEWLPDGTSRHFGTGASIAYGVNDAGAVVCSYPGPNSYIANICDGTVITYLNPLSGYKCSVARGINNDGVAVGESRTDNSAKEATLWNASGAHDIAPSDSSSYSCAYAVNDSGWAVGDYGHAVRGFLWDGTAAYNLNDLVSGSHPTIIWAYAINNSGTIACTVSVIGTGYRAAVLTLPEPSAAATLISCLGALSILTWRRRNRQTG